MSERDGYELGVPCWVAAVEPDGRGRASFYGELFGWETENLMPADAPGDYFLCRLRGRRRSDRVATESRLGRHGSHVHVESADDTATRAAELGGTVIGRVRPPGGGRMAVIADPSGAVFRLCSRGAQGRPGRERTGRVVDDSADHAGTGRGEDVLRRVFGWETETFDTGGGEITVWRVPGYVGGGPQQPVSRDVVGAMLSGDEHDGAPSPHWEVHFWIGDAAAAAEKAAARGGSVAAGPCDVPGFRQAVLADPQGAAFTLSQHMIASQGA